MPARRPALLRAVATWAALVALYAAGALLLPAAPGHQLTSNEAHRLMVAHSIVTDGDVELLDDYLARAWTSWGGVVGVTESDPLAPTVTVRQSTGRRNGQPVAPGGFVEPSGIGLGAALAPAYWVGHHTGIGGRLAVQLWGALLLAAAFVAAIGLARRVVPDPWATRGVLLVAISPPAVLGATQIGPTAVGALLLTGAVAGALAVRDEPRWRFAVLSALCAALLPWVWLPLAPVALLVAGALIRWMRRRRRGFTGFVALEILLISGFIYITVHDRLYGGPTPWFPEVGWSLPTFFDDLPHAAARALGAPLGLLIDRDYGLLRWAPVLGLVGVAAWRLVRWRRTRLYRTFAEEIHVEVIAAFLLLVFAASTVPYAILSPWPELNWLGGPGAAVALPVVAATVGWGWQRVPRTALVLSGLTVVATAWLLIAGALSGAVGTDPPTGPLPWGGVERVLPVLHP